MKSWSPYSPRLHCNVLTGDASMFLCNFPSQTSADVLGAQAPTTPDAAPNKLENALDREATLQKAVATAQKISERARQEAEARERAAAGAVEAARAEIQRAERARRDEQARLAAEAQARAAREAELAAQARQRREEAAREAAARERRAAAEAAQEAARRAERARLAARLLREREEAALKARAGLWIATAGRLQARIEPAQVRGDGEMVEGLDVVCRFAIDCLSTSSAVYRSQLQSILPFHRLGMPCRHRAWPCQRATS